MFAHEVINRIFSLEPHVLALIFLVYGILLYVLCPKSLRKIKYQHPGGILHVGYYQSLNWIGVSLFLGPLMIFVIGVFFKLLPDIINELERICSFVPQPGTGKNFTEYFREFIVSYDKYVIFPLIFILIIFNIYDFYSYFLKKDDRGKTLSKDWTVLYQNWNIKKISKAKNLIFDFFAYFMQTLLSIAGLIFIYKLVLVFSLILNIISGSNTYFFFQPNLTDFSSQLGLWPLEPVLVIYLTFIIIIGIYLVILRFIHVTRDVTWELIPRLVAIGGVLLLIAMFLVPGIIIFINLNRNLNDKKIELVKEYEDLKISVGTLNNDEAILAELKLQRLLFDLEKADEQSRIPVSNGALFIFMSLLAASIRLIIKPPGNMVDLISNFLGIPENKMS